jgi:hypothetical protein
LGSLGTAATNTPTVQTPGEYDDGEFGGMMIGRGNRNTPRKPAPVPLCPPQISHALRWRDPGRCGSEKLASFFEIWEDLRINEASFLFIAKRTYDRLNAE